jgi:tetratricopeptide (TPR) repeat protein
MKKASRLLSLAFLATTAFLSSCTLSQMIKMAKDQQLTVTPNPVELHADTVGFEVSGILPVKMLKRNTIYRASVNYKFQDKSEVLGDIEFKSTDFPNAKTEQPKVSKRFVMPYTDQKQKGEIVVVGIAQKMTGTKMKSTPELPIATGVITTSRLVKDPFSVSFADHGYNNQPEYFPVNVEFYFDKAKSNLKVNESKSDRATRLNAFISSKNPSKTIKILGSHSPEGREAKNSKLSADRAKEIEKYYRKMMKAYAYDKSFVDSMKFDIAPVFQDWTVFNKLVAENTNLTDGDKAEINAIVASEDTYINKAGKLVKLKCYKKVLLKEVYPMLRTAKTDIQALVPKKADYEISLLAKGIVEEKYKADTLKLEEMNYAASLTPDMNEKEAIYKAVIKKEDIWQTRNNLAAVLLTKASKEIDASKRTALIDEAVLNLEIARKVNENAMVMLNLGTAQLMKGNYTGALGTLNSALSKSPNKQTLEGINNLKGSLEIRNGKYALAVTTLEAADKNPIAVYNRGLALLLQKKLQPAKEAFDEATTLDANNANAFYCGAIVAAKMKDEALMAARLKDAVKLNRKFVERAIDDLEFRDYNTSEAFKNALK